MPESKKKYNNRDIILLVTYIPLASELVDSWPSTRTRKYLLSIRENKNCWHRYRAHKTTAALELVSFPTVRGIGG